MFCGIRYINGYLKDHSFKLVELTSNHLIYLLDFLFKFCILIFFVYKLSQLISNFIFKTLEDVGENHVFEITKGDKKEIDRIKKNEDRKKRHVIINLIITIIINIACGVLTNMIL